MMFIGVVAPAEPLVAGPMEDYKDGGPAVIGFFQFSPPKQEKSVMSSRARSVNAKVGVTLQREGSGCIHKPTSPLQ